MLTPGRAAAAAAALAVAGVAALGAVAPAGDPPAPGAARTATAPCPARGHADPLVSGVERDGIPTLPADFSFTAVASDGCSPVRWNPCEPVHFVVNPAGAPPGGVADVREAFRRLAGVTGMTYVDDGLTHERGGAGRAAYQPERYGRRWAPVLVAWEEQGRATAGIQVVGGGFPTRAGDVYVTARLTLDPSVVTDTRTRTTVAAGFGAGGTGPVGPAGVTWGRVILHELAHVAGLGHSRDPAQLMYPETTEHTTRPVRLADGDRAGLRHLGREAGCLRTPPPGTPTTVAGAAAAAPPVAELRRPGRRPRRAGRG